MLLRVNSDPARAASLGRALALGSRWGNLLSDKRRQRLVAWRADHEKISPPARDAFLACEVLTAGHAQSSAPDLRHYLPRADRLRWQQRTRQERRRQRTRR